MKIPEIKTSVVTPAKAGTEEPVRSVAPVERVSTAQSAKLQETIAQVKSLAPVDRAARVQEIARAVKSGQYQVSSQQIAQHIVDDAELDARMQNLLNTP